jgi:hypothetical protein
MGDASCFVGRRDHPRRILPQAGDGHVGVHHIPKHGIESGQRRGVLGVRMGGVAVADHDGLKFSIMASRGGFAADIGHRPHD